MQSFEHLITTRPHDVRYMMVSDLHLPTYFDAATTKNHEPVSGNAALMQAFLCLLDDVLALPKLAGLFILGDWFDAWLGDDVYLNSSTQQGCAQPIKQMVSKLSALSDKGCRVLVMVGNRDFLLGQTFCDAFGGELITEPYRLNIGKHTYRLEHGDALCTDDGRYQRFRRVVRHPIMQKGLISLPAKWRQAIAQKLKAKSKQDNQRKSAAIMDVNQDAVQHAVCSVDALIHGHTHRPNTHALNAGKARFVLGDWRTTQNATSRFYVEAVVGVIVQNNTDSYFKLVTFTRSI